MFFHVGLLLIILHLTGKCFSSVLILLELTDLQKRSGSKCVKGRPKSTYTSIRGIEALRFKKPEYFHKEVNSNEVRQNVRLDVNNVN